MGSALAFPFPPPSGEPHVQSDTQPHPGAPPRPRRLKLIGHLRRDLDPDLEVEVLDVNEEEARALLLSIDPLAELALMQEQLHARLRELTPTVSPELEAAWQAAAEAVLQERPEPGREVQLGAEQFLVLVSCRDERHQLEVLARLQADGLECRALVS
jgi:hypothetical protein